MRALSGVAALAICAGSTTASAQWADQPRSDLTASDVTAPLTAVQDGTLRVTARLANTGRAPATFHWSAYLTIGGVMSGAVELGTFGPISLDAGAERFVDETVALPSGVTGRHRLAVVADSLDAVDETNEYDNVAIAADITRIRPRAPNLVVRQVRLGAGARRPGEALSIDYRVANTGELPATFDVTAHLSRNSAASAADPEIARATISVPAGGAHDGRLDARVPEGLDTGDYAVAVIADPDLVVDEIVELDNMLAAATPLNVFTDALELRTRTLPGGTVFIRYHARLIAGGGDGRFAYTITDGALPVGLRLDPTSGVIDGRPLSSGAHEIEITVASASLEASRRFTITIAESGVDLTITTPELGRGTIGLPYHASLAAAGGEPPYHWNVIDGALPPGLDLTTGGWLAGIPTLEGHFTFSVQVDDGVGNRDAAEYQLLVEAANVVILSGQLAPVRLGEAIEVQLIASGGRPPYRWLAKSNLPPGTSLSEEGVLAGTPTRVGAFPFRVRAVDASRAGADDTALVHLVVEEPDIFEITSTAIPQAVIRQQVEFVLSASGGTPPLTWRIAPGDSLPRDFELVPSDTEPERRAVIRGTSLRPMAHAFMVQLEDAAGRRREAVLSLRVVFPDGERADGCRCATPTSGASWALLALPLIGLALRRRRVP